MAVQTRAFHISIGSKAKALVAAALAGRSGTSEGGKGGANAVRLAMQVILQIIHHNLVSGGDMWQTIFPKFRGRATQ